MWTVTFLVGGQQPVTLDFRTVEAALAASQVAGPEISVSDDFGKTFSTGEYKIEGVILLDLAGELEAATAKALKQAEAQARLTQIIQADPLTRGIVAPGRGPPLRK